MPLTYLSVSATYNCRCSVYLIWNYQACAREWHCHGNPMRSVLWDRTVVMKLSHVSFWIHHIRIYIYLTKCNIFVLHARLTAHDISRFFVMQVVMWIRLSIFTLWNALILFLLGRGLLPFFAWKRLLVCFGSIQFSPVRMLTVLRKQ